MDGFLPQLFFLILLSPSEGEVGVMFRERGLVPRFAKSTESGDTLESCSNTGCSDSIIIKDVIY